MRTARLLVLLVGPLVGGALLATAAIASKWEAIERLPGQSPVTVIVEEKPRNYFRITPDKPLTVPIEGPVSLRIVSRLELPRGSRQAVSYSLTVTEGGKELEREDTESSASSQVRGSEAKHEIGKSRRLGITVPEGRHVLTLSLKGAPALLVRMHQAAPVANEEPTVTLTPVEQPRSVTVTEGEKTILYHSVLPGRPVKLRVIGPTSLDLITRLDFSSAMRGTQTYRLGISDHGRRIREVEFKTTKSMTAVYTDLKDSVPSKFDRIRLPIGSGLHEISIDLLSPPRGSAEIHARIPQPRIGSAE